MSKITNALLVSVIAMGLSACETNPVAPAAPAAAPAKVAAPDCTFPSNPSEAAPDWVCTGNIEGYAVTATGSEKIVGGDADFAETMAMASARAKLAAQFKTQVAAMVKKYMETTGVGTAATIDKVNTSVTKQITNETLTGTKKVKSRTSSDGTLYVLVGVDEASKEKAVEKSVQTSMNNDKALWQQFKAKNGQDEMAAEIAKQKVDAAAAK